MSRPRIHDDASAEALLDAAALLLREGGSSALSVRGVADASGTSFRAVYAGFGSKQALIDALAERGYRSIAARTRASAASGEPGADLVRAGAVGFRGFAMEEPELFRLTFEQISAEALRQDRVSQAARASYAALEEVVDRARRAGLIHPERTTEACVFAFHSLCQGLAAAELAARQPPAGPGFWPMMRDVDLAGTWRDALTGLVRWFGAAPQVDPL